MKILYDHQVFSILKYGGITRYFCELMKNLPPECKFDLSVIFSDNQYLHENKNIFKILDILPNQNFRGKHYIRKTLHYFINQTYSRSCISSNNFDLFHPTFFDNYFLKVLKKPYVITVHDLIQLKFKETYFKHDSKGLQIESAVKNASRIIAISENTKKDIIDILNVDPDKIDVVYHGYNTPVQTKKENNYGKYILFVGQRDLYKNFITFAEAISKLLIREKDIKLVCVGAPFTRKEMETFARFGILKQILSINVDDQTLNGLYSNALMFVFPSIYEGFGMPILEAFANNCPVCLSNTSCFPEIAGNAGNYFDPYDHQSILSTIEKVLYDNNYAKEMIIAGQNRLTSFSWQKTAIETASSYYKAI